MDDERSTPIRGSRVRAARRRIATALRSNEGAQAWTVLRVAVAITALVGVAAPAEVVIRGAIEGDRHVPTVAANYFGFFTMVSNSAAAVVLLWAAVWFWTTRGGRRESAPLAMALAVATACIFVTGVVYNVNVPGMPMARNAILPWASVILHGIVPAFFVFDLFLGPNRRALPWSRVAWILAFPAAWVVYTLARANLVTNTLTGVPYWYPYPFLNPYQPGGYVTVAGFVALIGLVVLLAAVVVVAVGRWRDRDATRRAAASRRSRATGGGGAALPPAPAGPRAADPGAGGIADRR